MSATAETHESVRALHQPEPEDVACNAETWSGDHYGDALDLYWIRCTRLGRHDEHSDSGDTGCTWPLDEYDRAVQESIPTVCELDGEPYPCRTLQALEAKPADGCADETCTEEHGDERAGRGIWWR